MGVPGLWDILRPAGETRSLTHLAVTDGFEANPEGHRGFRVGIDASIWFFHAAYGKEGENPELRTLFFKCTRLMSAPFLPVFVFDGPKRPEIKRGKHISGNNHWLIQGMQEIINAFGFEWRIAPGEAEAELAYMNRVGVIDAVMTDDVDTFVFGAAMVVRNSSITLSGNRGHSLKNAAGKDDGNHAATYKLADITRHPDIQLTQGGLILIAILRGGDYHPAGLAGCGPAIAHGLARCGFGDSLLNAARTLSDEHLPGFLVAWRAEVREELRTNARGLLQRKNPTLAKALTDDFPNMEVLLSYTDPITSEPKGRTARNVNMDWQKEPDLGKIAGLCEMYFEWGVKEIIIKRFRTVLWPSAVLRILRRSVLIADKRKNRLVERDPGNMPVTPRKKGKQGRPTPPGTPSTMIAKHFSSLQLGSPSRSQGVESDDEEPADNLVVKIHSSRQHASTDGILEYRLEIAPQQLVHLCEEGVKGLRTALATGLEESDEEGGEDDEDGGNNRKTKAKKPPPDPLSHLRIWLPACMVRMVHPDLVDEFEGVRDRRQAKKAGKSAAGTSGAAASRAKKVVTKAATVAEEEEEYSDSGPSPGGTQKKSAAARTVKKVPAVHSGAVAEKPREKSKAAQANRPQRLDDFFAASKSTAIAKAKALAKPRVTSSTAKISALFGDSQASSSRLREEKRSKVIELSDSSDDDPVFPTRLSSLTQSSWTSSSASSSSLLATSSKAISALSELDSDEPVKLPSRSQPRPFPLSFGMDDDSASTHENKRDKPINIGRPALPSERTRQRPPTSPESETFDAQLRKSPRKSPKHSSPHSSQTKDSDDDEGYGSPTPQRPRATASSSKPLLVSPVRKHGSSKPVDRSIIEILSDSDSESPPSKLAPLLLAKARANRSAGTRTASANSMTAKDGTNATAKAAAPKPRTGTYGPEDIIDLTCP